MKNKKITTIQKTFNIAFYFRFIVLGTFLSIFLSFFCGLSVAQTVIMWEGQPISFEKSLEVSALKEKEGDIRESTRFLNHAATIKWEEKEYDQAIAIFEKSIAMNKTIDNEHGIMGIYSNLGMIYADIKQYEKSLSYFQQVLAYRKQGKDKVSIISSLINTSVVLNNLKRYEESAELLEEALVLAKEMSDADQMKSCYGMLAETYEKMGNSERTIHYFNLYRTFHEYVQGKKVAQVSKSLEEERLRALLLEAEKKNAALELLQANLQIRKKEAILSEKDSSLKKLIESNTKQDLALRILSDEAKIQALQLEKTNQQDKFKTFIIVSLTIVVLLLLSLAILFYRKSMERKRNNILILEKNNQLKRQATELQTLNRVKDKLFSIIAHDLRSPFNTFRALVELLKSDLLNKDDKQKILDSVSQTTNVTLGVIDNLLLWTKSQMQGLQTNKTILQLKTVADDVIAFSGEVAKQKQILITNQIPDQIKVYADQNQLLTVFRNLIGNAIKFTPHKGNIYLTAVPISPTIVEVAVTDTGIGMSKEVIAKLFNVEMSFTTSGTDNEKGTGLGLLLCKEFVENNGGTISVKSEPKQGTSFIFTLQQA